MKISEMFHRKIITVLVLTAVIIGVIVFVALYMAAAKSKLESTDVVFEESVYNVPVEEDKSNVLKSMEASLTDGQKVTISVLGKKDNQTGLYGVREIRIMNGDELIQSILIQKAIALEGIIGIDTGYSESATLEEAAELIDINFDGCPDLQVCAQVTDKGTPYYYWCWNPDIHQFEYLYCLPLKAIDEENKQLITWQEVEEDLFFTYYYEVGEDNSLKLVDNLKEDLRPKTDSESEKKEDLGTGQYLKDIDWENVITRISEEEAAAVQKYQAVLEGEKFTWIYRSDKGEEPDTYIHEKKQLTIQEMLDEELRLNGIDAQDAVVDSFLFADVFQSGEENICLLFRHLGWYWLILHEEDGVIYGIDMPVRWFAGVQKDGLYFGSGGAAINIITE